MRVALIGASGQLGTDLQKALSGWDLVALNHSEIEICDFKRVREVLSRANPQVVINTAAFNRVDDCEDDPAGAFLVNALGPRNLARISSERECHIVHVSTDYVFGGEQAIPYAESDSPNPLSVYGVSKLAGECFVRNICPKHLLVRTSGLYGVAGSRSKGGNFVDTMIRLAGEGRPIRVVDDQVLTPTYTADLAAKLKELIDLRVVGTYHVTNSGQCSWYEFAATIFDFLGLDPELSPAASESLGAKARRPAYSVLEHRGLKACGIESPRVWTDALRAYLREKGHLQG